MRDPSPLAGKESIGQLEAIGRCIILEWEVCRESLEDELLPIRRLDELDLHIDISILIEANTLHTVLPYEEVIA